MKYNSAVMFITPLHWQRADSVDIEEGFLLGATSVDGQIL